MRAYLTDTSVPLFYDPDFRREIELHLHLLIGSHDKTQSIDAATAMRFRGDFHGLSIHLGVPKDYVWIHMRLNGYSASSEYDGTEKVFLTVPAALIDRIINTYNGIRKKV